MQLRVLCAPAGITPGCANSDPQGEGAVTALQRPLLGMFLILLLQLDSVLHTWCSRVYWRNAAYEISIRFLK